VKFGTLLLHKILFWPDIELKGEKRKMLMQAPKNGFFYILDRATGELLSAEKYTAKNYHNLGID